jgi:glutamate-1-semialdehyde 2,1-aminomutase
METAGRQLAAGFNEAARELGIEDYVYATGRPSCLVFITRDSERMPSQAFRTLFLQEMLTRGVLAQSFVVSAAHTTEDIEETICAARQVLRIYRRAIEAGTVEGLLAGRPVAPAIRRRTFPRQISSS